MSDMKAFEIHTYQGGKWKIDSVFDDRDLALFEAQRMDGSGRYSGVRVVEEVFVEQTQETKTRTIYRGTKVEAANAAELQRSIQVRQQASGAPQKKQIDPAQRKRAAQKRVVKKKANPARLVTITVVLLIVAAAALAGLHFAKGGSF